MGADERCELTDLEVSGCGHCKAAARPTEGTVWEALYLGSCATCGVGFDVGRRVKWTEGGQVQHAYHP